MSQWFIDELAGTNTPFLVAYGSVEQRMQQVLPLLGETQRKLAEW